VVVRKSDSVGCVGVVCVSDRVHPSSHGELDAGFIHWNTRRDVFRRGSRAVLFVPGMAAQ